MGWEVIFWNHTPFDLEELGYKEIRLKGKPRAKTDLLKRAKIEAELNHFGQKFKDPIYHTYKFSASNKGLKKKIKKEVVAALVKTHRGEKGLERLREKMKASERNGDFYKECKKILEKEKPDLVFSTNQRPVTAIAPLSAAQDLGISTGTFIFSWDNLPKATMVVETEHYFVWSEHMKQELLEYYPFCKPELVHITGTPQFEPHYNKSLLKSRSRFFEENDLDPNKELICFSGDDVTTSPNDPQYLEDVAAAVQKLNGQGYDLGIIFRRCPTDFSSRYQRILEKYSHLISPVEPAWKRQGDSWNTILPTQKDLEIQMNTIAHSRAVVNLGSSMVFDYAVFNKPCLFLNYDTETTNNEDWSPKKVYNFVHFRSMPSKDAVIWLNSKEEIETKLKTALAGAPDQVAEAKTWFHKINLQPSEKASQRIWEKIDGVVNNGLPRPLLSDFQ